MNCQNIKKQNILTPALSTSNNLFFDTVYTIILQPFSSLHLKSVLDYISNFEFIRNFPVTSSIDVCIQDASFSFWSLSFVRNSHF